VRALGNATILAKAKRPLRDDAAWWIVLKNRWKRKPLKTLKKLRPVVSLKGQRPFGGTRGGARHLCPPQCSTVGGTLQKLF